MAGRGTAVLGLATLIWGSTFVVSKEAIGNYAASRLVFGRFFVASVVLLPFVRRGRKLWWACLELGAWLWLGFMTQTIGLKYTTVGRSAFITALSVIFVPILSGILGRGSSVAIWVAAVMAFVGVALMSHDGAPPNVGDVWTLGCAVVWGIYITRLETLTARLPSRALAAGQLWVVTVLSAGWVMAGQESAGRTPWFAILYLGIAATAVTTWLQALGQKWVSAQQAAVLFTLEPVWASVFGWLVLREAPGVRGWIGAGMILIAAVVAQLPNGSEAAPEPVRV